ncbi:DNA mismatch repair protein MutT [Bifidobacterium lemurum]|uniref:DNA mismatch repair protein MutT n=2 Tax=Bifidobacterium lemurum TaxID=1603886 RepID=A0A261FRV7_9BIFI|nr:NUDIX hydrolase [Bifidobacterium lemurum]OZG61922.1 DNA mismatch repair protein MutT [Bifidobacterium lemurum]
MRRIVEAAGGILYRLRPESPESEHASGADGPRSDGRSVTGMATATDTKRILERIEVCVVHRPKYDDWSWPKGKLELNESHRHAAVREISEETGVPVALGPYLGEVEYPLDQEGRKSRRSKDRTADTKHILYWMATPVSAEDAERMRDALGPVQRADVGEIDDIVWVSVTKARKMLTHSTDRDVLALFVDRIEEGAAHAVPVLLVRHGKAEARKTWKGTDANRPITPRGAAASYALNRELACYNPTRLATSPWLRCQQTLQGLSWQINRPMIHLDTLTEDAYAENPKAAWDTLLAEIELAFASGQTDAICMHRPVIGGMFKYLRAMCASTMLEKRLISKSPYMPTGTAVALFVAGGPGGPTIIDIQKVAPLVY